MDNQNIATFFTQFRFFFRETECILLQAQSQSRYTIYDQKSALEYKKELEHLLHRSQNLYLMMKDFEIHHEIFLQTSELYPSFSKIQDIVQSILKIKERLENSSKSSHHL